MGSWNDVLRHVRDSQSVLDDERAEAIRKLAEYRKRNVVCYYSGWLQGVNDATVSISDDDINGLMNAMYHLDRSKGLDLVLHTPGGDLAATEAIVNYLRDLFGDDVVAVVPQMAMSAGTMIACSCKTIIMGKHSSLGPTDPQYGGVAAGGVVEEFDQAVEDIKTRPESLELWRMIIGKYHPTFLGDCQKAVDMSRQMVGRWLRENMLSQESDSDAVAKTIVGFLCDHKQSAMHNRHFSHKKLEGIGLHIELLEDDSSLQELVLTLHHSFMISFQKTGASKIVESSNGSRWIVAGVSDKQ